MFDIIAVKPTEYVVFIQAKRSKTDIKFEKLYEEDLNGILDALPAMPRDVQCEAWVWVDRKGWQQKLIIKRAGDVLEKSDIVAIREALSKGLEPFGENTD
jgi:hypothetical protein